MKNKTDHEIRDPIHIFIHMSSDERKILDSRPVQRLRYIHQLALTNLIYPGASHPRFEHSIGTMEIATRIFDVVTDDNHSGTNSCSPGQTGYEPILFFTLGDPFPG